MSVLFTGATGFLGSRLLRRLLDDDDRDEPITVVGRAAPSVLRPRVEAALLAAGRRPLCDGALRRLRYLAGDLTVPGLGWDARTRDAATEDLDTIWHCAAVLALRGDPVPLFKTNVGGARSVLALAERAPAARLFHVSTAYVAGLRHRGHIRECDLSERHGFRTYYEETKFNVERLIHAWSAHHERPATVFRPSLLVTDRPAPPGLPAQPLSAYARLIDASLRARGGPGSDGAGATADVHLAFDPLDNLNLLQVDYAVHAMIRAAAHPLPASSRVRTLHVTHPRNTTLTEVLRGFELACPGLRVRASSPTRTRTPNTLEALLADRLPPLSSFVGQRRTYDRANLLSAVGDLPDPPAVDRDYLARGLHPRPPEPT
ncbi:hypothetical protein B4N89_42010 [Embleya scabrispora]|uniref:Thioester reductase (TE) domain-containing protein n=1 Tax=Embleya scabrispora TaxID=159449 RepID=A0A1T3NLR4_9ACTN|nr:SDR family oxidoreductase [Embleya scabrispora]OPC77615.1 hypothetical protein B4N89_42010 [Embleya scabrispora]